MDMVVVVVEVVVALGYMLELVQGKSSYNDVNKLAVVVEQVVMGLLGVLVVLGVLGHLGLLGHLEDLLVHLVLAHPAPLVDPSVQELLVVLELVVGVEVGVVEVVVVVVVEVGKELLDLLGLLLSKLVTLGLLRRLERLRILLHSHREIVFGLLI